MFPIFVRFDAFFLRFFWLIFTFGDLQIFGDVFEFFIFPLCFPLLVICFFLGFHFLIFVTFQGFFLKFFCSFSILVNFSIFIILIFFWSHAEPSPRAPQHNDVWKSLI